MRLATMGISDISLNGRLLATGVALLVFVSWAAGLLGFGLVGTNPLVSLAIVSTIPFVLAVPAFLIAKMQRRMTLSIPFLLPGLLIFFKQNDALIPLIGNIPLNDVLGIALFTLLVTQLSRNDIASTFRSASFIFLILIGLLLAFVISWVHAVELSESRSETLTFLKDVVFATLIALSIRSVGDLKAFTGWLIFSTSFTAATIIGETVVGESIFPNYRVAEYWQTEFRSSGASLESVPFVATMIIIGLSAATMLAIRQPKARWLLTFAVGIGISAVIISITRSAVVALGITSVFVLWRFRTDSFFPLAAYLAGVLAVIVTMAMPQSVVEKFTALGNTYEDRTIARRVGYLEIGADLFQSSPILGIGAGNYPKRYTSDDYRYDRVLRTERRALHNLYLQYPVEIGLIGAILFYAHILAIGAVFWRGGQSSNTTLRLYSEAFLVGYFAVCIQLFFLASKSFLGIWILTAAAIAVVRLFEDDLQADSRKWAADEAGTQY